MGFQYIISILLSTQHLAVRNLKPSWVKMTTMISTVTRSLCAVTIFTLLFMCVLASSSSKADLSYYETLGPYFHHENITGPNPTAIVTLPRGKSEVAFGAMVAFDDPLTATPYINSTIVARAEGLQVVVSLIFRVLTPLHRLCIWCLVSHA